MELLVDAPYDLNGNYLVIDKDNVSSLDGKTITGTYHPTERLSEGRKIEGGIVIDNVTVNLTIENVNVGYGTDIIDDAAGILLKGKAKLNLTVQGKNSLAGTYSGAMYGWKRCNTGYYGAEYRKPEGSGRCLWCCWYRRKSRINRLRRCKRGIRDRKNYN